MQCVVNIMRVFNFGSMNLEKMDFRKLSWLLANEAEAEQITGSGEPEAAWQSLHE